MVVVVCCKALDAGLRCKIQPCQAAGSEHAVVQSNSRAWDSRTPWIPEGKTAHKHLYKLLARPGPGSHGRSVSSVLEDPLPPSTPAHISLHSLLRQACRESQVVVQNTCGGLARSRALEVL